MRSGWVILWQLRGAPRSQKLLLNRNIMDQYIEFIGNHPWMMAALAGTICLILFLEFERMSAVAKNISPMEATRLQNDAESVLVLDVRDEKEFATGHLINAVNIPVTQIEKRVNELKKYKTAPIIAVCESGMRSQRACKALEKEGFEQLNSLQGGMSAWAKANLPMSTKG